MRLPGSSIDPRWLQAHLTTAPDELVVVADVRWVPGGHARGPFAGGHIPGAICVDLDADLAAPPGAGPGRHPLPSPQGFAESMAGLGIGDETTVVAYDDASGSVAARLWWMLRVLGREVGLLDLPSLDAWTAIGGTLETGPPRGATASFTPQPWPTDRVVDADAVRGALRRGSAIVIDARAPERYRGETEPYDPVAGHIPGARNAAWQSLLGPDGHLLDAGALARRFDALGVLDGADTIASCGSGVTATFALFALERAGLGPGRLYEGSWSDWVSDPGRPVATGSEPGDPA